MNSDGLMTTVQPAASAGASFQAVSISGEFHGVMKRTHADRLLEDVVEVVRPIDRHHRALDFVGEPAVVIEPLRHVLGLRHHLRDQLAVVAHLDLAQVLGVLLDQLRDAAHASCRAPSASSAATARSRRRGRRPRRRGRRRPCRTPGSAPRARPCRGRTSGTSCRRRRRPTCRRCRSGTPCSLVGRSSMAFLRKRVQCRGLAPRLVRGARAFKRAEHDQLGTPRRRGMVCCPDLDTP